jgi:hypothetical protein
MRFALSDMSGKIWFAIWGALLLVCLGAVIATRLSYTDFNSQPNELAELPYLYYAANHEDIALARGDFPEGMGLLDMDELIGETPVIVCAVFEGSRSYVYQSFVSDIRVTEVLRGDGINIGQSLKLFEPVRVRQLPWLESWKQDSPDSFAAFIRHFGYQDDVVPHVAQPTGGAYLYGGTMMGEGREYLLFLYPRAYPSAEDRTGKTQEYVMENNPYARLTVPAADSIERPPAKVAVFDPQHDFISFRESSDYEIILANATDVELYEQTRDAIFERLTLIVSQQPVSTRFG